jgi:hypothetical protein
MTNSVKHKTDHDIESLAQGLLAQRFNVEMKLEQIRELDLRVTEYEMTYGLRSDCVHDAIENGSLQETREICRWIMDLDLLRRLRAG